MMKINTILLLMSLTLTGYLVKQNANWSHDNRLSVKQELDELVQQIDELQIQVSGMRGHTDETTADAGTINTIREEQAEIAYLVSLLENLQSQLARQNPSHQVSDIQTAHENMTLEERSEQNRAGNALVDSFIDSGVLDGHYMIQLHQQLSQMDPQQQQEALQRLVIAINEQRVDIDPSVLP